MYRKISAIVLPLAIIALIAISAWGFQVREEKNTVLIKAENQYQRAFHELTDNVEQLHYELAKIMILNGEESQRKALANVWRLTNQAQSNISQLPLALLPFHQTQQLLHNVSGFAYRTSVRDMRDKPLSEAEKKTLANLHRRTSEIAAELRKVQTAVIGKQLRWMDVEVALADERGQRDNAIIDGFKLVNEKVVEFEEFDWGPSAQNKHLTNEPLITSAKPLSDAALKKRAGELVGGTAVRQVRDKKLLARGIAEWQVKHHSSDETVSVQMNRYTGQALMFLHSRPLGGVKMKPEQALAKAEQYMKRHKFPALEMVAYDRYERSASITFVENKHKTLYYPHKVVVNVALDNGEIIGLQSQLPFAESVHGKSLSNGSRAGDLSQKAARALLEPGFKVFSVRRAVIENERREAVACYQFEGRLGEQHYRIFLNAVDGREEQVERLSEVEI
jgi:spore germination protein